jgi:UDP-N-acetyl-2-amino-2-deoxyglucuronate dehydrogenase
LGVWRDFLAALDERRPPRVSGHEALRVHRLIDALLTAAASDGKVEVSARD